jgi:NADPH-dependent 2,4-dienoyl-CoA reductase/sulfur reductase-like enzyme
MHSARKPEFLIRATYRFQTRCQLITPRCRSYDPYRYGRKPRFEPLVVETTTHDHKIYYPGATELVIRLVGDRCTRELLGAQIFGSYGKEVSKRIDSIATALHHRMPVDALSDLDLSYTPPLSSPWDPLQMAAQAWTAAQNHGAVL